jgi:hypothetical protein
MREHRSAREEGMTELLGVDVGEAAAPRLERDAPIELVDARVLFRPRPVRRQTVPALLALRASRRGPSDEGASWSEPRPTPFRGSNVRLSRLRSGAVLCADRDEDPARRGVSVSITHDGFDTWRFAGQLYAAGEDASHVPGSVCGYPTFASIPGSEALVAAALHSCPTPAGSDLHFLVLRDRF